MIEPVDDPHQNPRATVKYEIVNAPDLPVIWFDTHAVSELAEAVTSDRTDQQRPLLRRLHQGLVEHRKANRIVVLETDQMYEAERAPSIADRCVEMLVQLSQGARSSYMTVQRRQLQIGMSARLTGDIRAAITWDTCWETSPFADHSVKLFGDDVIVRAGFEPSADDLAARRSTAEKIAEGWEDLRARGRGDKRPYAERLAQQVATERAGNLQVITHLIQEAMRRQDNGDTFTASELDVQNRLVSDPLRLWRDLGGAGLLDMLEFYGSEHHHNLPFVDIGSQLTAARITGSERIKASDHTDIKNISAFLPYCTHMVLDRAMIDAVTKAGLSEQYGTRVLRLRELGDVLETLG